MYELDISFIVPTKNEEGTILECTDSIISNAEQLPYSYEIIVIDDQSTDNTGDLVTDKIIDVDLNGSIIQPESHITGVSAIRNHAVSHAKGKVLVFIDGDVILRNDWHLFFRQAYKTIEQDSTTITGAQYFVDTKDSNWIINSWFKNRKSERNVNYINAGHLIIDHDFFNRLGGFDEGLATGEDTDLCQRARINHDSDIINDSNLVAIHLGFPRTLKDFFNRERWHGKGNWQGDHLKSKMTLMIIAFWLGLLLTPFYFPMIALSTFVSAVLAGKKSTYDLINIYQCMGLSAIMLFARGLSLIDVFTGKVSRTRG